MPDPIAFLRNAGTEWDIACIAVERAAVIQGEARAEEWKSVTKRIGTEVANAVAQQLANLFR